MIGVVYVDRNILYRALGGIGQQRAADKLPILDRFIQRESQRLRGDVFNASRYHPS